MNTGYVSSEHLPEHPVFDPERLGAVPPNATADWTPYLPPQNVQQNTGVESEACTSYGTLDSVEALAKFLFKDGSIWSKRFLAWASGTTPQGNDPWTVGTALATKGTVLDSVWPQDASLTTWAELYATPPQNVQTDALAWPAHYALTKEWVNANPTGMMAALEFSPLGAAGFAWVQDANGLYYTPQGALPCHFFSVVGFVENQYWIVFDSYENDIKHLRWDYQFSDVIKYGLTSNVQGTPAAANAWARFVYWLQQVLGLQVGRTFGAMRSPEWPRVRAAHLLKEPTCRICGGTKKLTVHHIQPFHLNPSLELDDTNLITLCEGAGATGNHHLTFGHFDNFRTKWNPNIRVEAPEWLKRLSAKDESQV